MRLINADRIKEFADYYTELDGEPLTEREQLLVTCVCEKIRELMPTAYDVDKVVGRLERERNPVYRADGSLMSARMDVRIDKAIEIVKAGMGTDTKEKEESSSAKEET